MTHHTDLLDSELIDQREQIRSMILGPKCPRRLAAIPKAPEVRRDQTEPVSKSCHHGLPGQPELRPAMQQKQRRSLTHLRHVKARAIRFDH